MNLKIIFRNYFQNMFFHCKQIIIQKKKKKVGFAIRYSKLIDNLTQKKADRQLT